MNELLDLSVDEAKILKAFRDSDRLVRARIMIAASTPTVDPTKENMMELEFMAAYLDCSDYGRERCLEAAQIFATSSSTGEAHVRLAELEDLRSRCEVVDISTARPI
jgi:hypothetical protein